jgi:hypothetical protein
VSGGEKDELSRGAGLAVGPEGIALHHHFLLPRDGSTFQFLARSYTVELFAVVVGIQGHVQLKILHLDVTEAHAARLAADDRCGLYFSRALHEPRRRLRVGRERAHERLSLRFSVRHFSSATIPGRPGGHR